MSGRKHTFQITHKSEDPDELGKIYEGLFTCQKLTIMSKSRMAVRKSQLCGGMYCVRDENTGAPTGQGIDEDTEWLNYMIALLEESLLSKPEWFDLENIFDDTIVLKVYEEVAKFQSTFRGQKRNSDKTTLHAGGGEESGSDKSEEAGHDDNSPKVVDEKVPIALDA